MKDVILEPLQEHHELTRFCSAIDSLDDWFIRLSKRAQKQGSARTKVLLSGANSAIVGYYSISPTVVDRSELLSAAAGGISSVPAYLLARLAIDRSRQGIGLGGELLAAALRDILAASKLVGGRLVVVDAIDDSARSFYEHFGFRKIEQSRRLFIMMSEIS